MKQLSNKETKELEHTTTPLANVLHQASSELNSKQSEALLFKSFSVLGWTHNGRLYDIPGARNITNTALHKKVATLGELLGFKQNYHTMYWVRTAVWGLQMDDIKFILYYSNEGTKIQIDRKCNDACAQKLINRLYGLLIVDPALTE